MKVSIRATTLFQKIWKEYQTKKNRFIILEGGSGSGKTYSLAQLFNLLLLQEKNTQITICRKTLPALKATAMKDFFNIAKELGIYKEENHNKSEHTYRYKGNEVDFISVDQPIKIRSRRRNFLWMNEANEFNKDDYMQLSMRTDKQIYMDYNPSHQFHWIYDDIHTKDNAVIIPSTYKDNPFLPREIVKEIEGYQKVDKNYWRVYGLGLRGMAETLVYTHWEYCDELPEHAEKIMYGLDFSYNGFTALVKIAEKDGGYYWQEELYQRYLTNQDLIEKLKELVEDGRLSYNDIIYGDAAEPARIEEIRQAGFNIRAGVKGKAKDGIDHIKSRKFYIVKSSVNLLKEVQSYSWKEKDGQKMEEPVKARDDLLDAGRYAIMSEKESFETAFF